MAIARRKGIPLTLTLKGEGKGEGGPKSADLGTKY